MTMCDISSRRATNSVGCRHAFTLIELLVVVAVIALLIGLLLPALSRARDSAQLISSLSRLRQIATAEAAYIADFRESSLFPELLTAGGRIVTPEDDPGVVNLGGAVANVRGHRLGGMTQNPLAFDWPSLWTDRDKPLNAYLFDDISIATIDDPADEPSIDPGDRARRELFQTPGRDLEFDVLNNDDQISDKSLYNVLGTSYLANTFWLQAEIDGLDVNTLSDRDGYRGQPFWYFSRYASRSITRWNASRTILAADGGLIIGAHQGQNVESESPYNRDRTFAAAFIDGHASRIDVGPEDINALRRNPGARLLPGNPFGTALNDDAGQWQFFPEYRDDDQLQLIRDRSRGVYLDD
ncbi:MAG: prepilin-type N-terminal cleavage/methylation domain-containing protein [Planctomycetota bacterium]